MTQAQLGQKAFGKPDNTAIQSLKKGSSPAVDRLQAMATAIGWELYFGPPRLNPSILPGLKEDQEETDLHTKNAFRAGYIPLPWIDPGTAEGQPPVAFSLAWLDRSGLLPDNLACVLGKSDGTTATDAAKPLLVIDRAASRTGFDWWAIRDRSVVSAARVAFEGTSAVIMPEADGDAPRLIHDTKSTDIALLGKVVWIGRRPPAK